MFHLIRRYEENSKDGAQARTDQESLTAVAKNPNKRKDRAQSVTRYSSVPSSTEYIMRYSERTHVSKDTKLIVCHIRSRSSCFSSSGCACPTEEIALIERSSEEAPPRRPPKLLISSAIEAMSQAYRSLQAS